MKIGETKVTFEGNHSQNRRRAGRGERQEKRRRRRRRGEGKGRVQQASFLPLDPALPEVGDRRGLVR